MSKLNQVWVVASDKATIVELTSGAKQLGEEVVLVMAGDKENAVNANTVYCLNNEGTFLNCLPAIVELVKEKKPDLVITDTSKNGRIVAGYIAAAVGTNVMTDVGEVVLEDGKVTTKRMVYGGGAFKTERAGATAVVCAGAGVFEAGEVTAAGNVVDVAVEASTAIQFKGKAEKPVVAVNLAGAKKIVCVGRGVGAEENLRVAEEFAGLIGAEIGCSRPVAEENHWLPKERYIGVSGAIVKPELYIVAGVSGQVQHMAGANQSGVVVAINKDKSAPVFSQCDYGIVGDMNKILAALSEKLK